MGHDVIMHIMCKWFGVLFGTDIVFWWGEKIWECDFFSNSDYPALKYPPNQMLRWWELTGSMKVVVKAPDETTL